MAISLIPQAWQLYNRFPGSPHHSGYIPGDENFSMTALRLCSGSISNLGDLSNDGCKVQLHGYPGMLPGMASMMHFIASIEDADIIQMILKHLGLWETRNHDPPN